MRETVCGHPTVYGDTDDARCATCDHHIGRPRGLGDVVHGIAEATGIGPATRMLVGDCGCAKRRAALNAAVPFTDKERHGTDL